MTSLAASLATRERLTRLRASLATMRERDWLCWSLYGAWAVFTAWVFMNVGAVSFDESWFLEIAQPISPVEAFQAGANLGYGQLYWVLLSAMPSVLAARIVWLGFYLATPLVIALSVPRRVQIYVICAWLAMPSAWWYGKIIGPEIPNLFLSALAMALLLRGRIVWAGFVFGMAVGIKILATPLALIFVWPLMEAPRKSIPTLAHAAAAGLGGFILINPSILYAPGQILNQIFGASGARNTEWTQIIDVLSNVHMQWDMVQTGGLTQFLMPVWLLLAIFMAAGKLDTPRTLLAASGLSLAGFLAIFMIPDRFLGWYWLPFLPVVLMLAGSARMGGKWFTPIIAAMAVCNLPLISTSVHEKHDQIQITSNRESISGCLAETLEGELVTDVVNHSEFGGLNLPKIPGRYITYRTIEYYGVNSGNWSHFLLGQRMVGSAYGRSFLGIPDIRMLGDCGGVMVFRREDIRRQLLAGE